MSLYPVDQNLPDGSKYPGMDPVTGKFTSGDAQQGIKASALPAETVNFILDNLGELVEFGNGSSNPADTDQVKKAVRNLVAPVGKLYTQYPFMPTPDVFYGGLGTWENISIRAVGYGISDVNSGEPTGYISRGDAGQGLDFTDADLSVDDQIAGGTYAGKYVRSVESYAGLFFRVEGGNAAVFNDANQLEKLLSHTHSMQSKPAGSNVSSGQYLQSTDTSYYNLFNDIEPFQTRILETGEDENIPTNKTKRFWIRRI